MNTTKKLYISWLKQGFVLFLVLMVVFFNAGVVIASTSSSSSSSSSSASAFTQSIDGSSTSSASADASAASTASASSNGNDSASAAAASASSNSNSNTSTASAVAVSCSASASSIALGSLVTYIAHASGGSLSYTYSWSGDESLSGSNPSVLKTYLFPGTKTANVVVSSGSASASATCSVVITETPPPPPAPLQGSCSAETTAAAQVGDTVTWSATGVTGGNGNYTYSWSGTDSLSGTESLISKAYSTSGTKHATLVITSDGQSIARNCSTYVNPLPTNDLIVSCSASASAVELNSPVTFTSNVIGGSGSNTYSWSGSDALSGTGSSVSKTYTSAGTKTASVIVHSGSATATANCSVVVTQTPPPPADLQGSCMANTSGSQVGDTVTWSTVGVTGGTGSFTYSWSGDEGLSGSGSSVSKVYATSGTKNATVVISSGNQSITRNCNTFVNPIPQPGALTGSCIANTSSAQIGDAIVWSTTGVTGGTGSYTYSWSGDDNLTGSSQSVSHTYGTSGNKNASVIIASGSQSITRTCSTFINTSGNQSNNTTNINNSYNTTNNTTYNNTTNNNYNSSSNQHYSNYQYRPYQYQNNNYYNNLNASCVANQTSAYVGDGVYWSATGVTGGNGRYTYSWSGTDGLYGNGYSVYKNYNYVGTKFAYLTVYSNGQSVTRTCSLYVNNRYAPVTYINPQINYPYNGVSLSQVPYTGLESNMKVILFTLGLIFWSAIVTYVVISRKKSLALSNVKDAGASTESAVTSDDAEQSARQQVLMGHDNMLSDLESFARNKNVIVSVDALAAIVDIADNDQKRAETLLSSLANRHATDSEWTTLDLSKVQSAIA